MTLDTLENVLLTLNALDYSEITCIISFNFVFQY